MNNLFVGMFLFTLMHTMAWMAANLQLVNPAWASRSLAICVVLAIPTTLAAYYGTRFAYAGLGDSVWGVRFMVFGASWFVFPILTWVILKESPWTPKTLLCTLLAFLIMGIQIFWKTESQ